LYVKHIDAQQAVYYRTVNLMINSNSGALDVVFAALSDPTRRGILSRLRDGHLRVTEIAAPLPISLAAASKHVKMLERAGLVTRDVRGRDHYIALNAGPLAEASEWVADHRAFWEARLNALSSYLG
jgi:DNA-binding transcriptional ArsR family regulator